MGDEMAQLDRKKTLIKYILSSYPIYTSTMFIVPMKIMNNISIEIMKFLWQGGKTQSKKFHLVNWAMIIEDRAKSGLGLRDLGMMKKSLGAKAVWRLIL